MSHTTVIWVGTLKCHHLSVQLPFFADTYNYAIRVQALTGLLLGRNWAVVKTSRSFSAHTAPSKDSSSFQIWFCRYAFTSVASYKYLLRVWTSSFWNFKVSVIEIQFVQLVQWYVWLRLPAWELVWSWSRYHT